MKNPAILAFLVLTLTILACGGCNNTQISAPPVPIPVTVIPAPTNTPSPPASQADPTPTPFSLPTFGPGVAQLGYYKRVEFIGFVCYELSLYKNSTDGIRREYPKGWQVSPCFGGIPYQETQAPEKILYTIEIDPSGNPLGNLVGPTCIKDAEYAAIQVGDIIPCFANDWGIPKCDYLHPIRP